MDTTIRAISLEEFTIPTDGLGSNEHGSPIYRRGGHRELVRWMVTIETVGGVDGRYVPMSSGPQSAVGQVSAIAKHLVGTDVADRGHAFELETIINRKTDHIGYGMLDICMWDVAGKYAGMPIVELLGRARDRLPAYASTMHGDAEADGLSSPEAYAEFAVACVEQGYPGFKFHPISQDAHQVVATIDAIATAVGDRAAVMLDCSSELRSFADALYVGRACDDARLFWLEDPMADGGTSVHAHRQLRERISTPLLVGEHLRGLPPKADLIVAGATDFLRADPDLDLGITGAMKIAHLAECFGIDVELHAAGPAQRHCLGAIRNSNFYELGLVHPVLGNTSRPDVLYASDYSDQLEAIDADGCVSVPDGPGLGVAYDLEFIAAHVTGRRLTFSAT